MSVTPRDDLEALLASRPGALAIAVSGGLDSLTLMAVAARVRGGETRAVHAVSPAVPDEATSRVRALAESLGWPLEVISAGELEDPAYRANPLNRCYFCKSNLFDTMTATFTATGAGATLATGTNRDDLGDFRPGLKAARERSVWQPYVEAAVGKDEIRAIARAEGLPEVAALPAQPCLASRIETGIAIRAEDLAFVHRVEQIMTERLGPGDHRCRVTRGGIVAQTPPGGEALRDPAERRRLETEIATLCAGAGRHFAGLEAYRKGSAFLRPAS